MQQESQEAHVDITARRIADLILFPVERSLSFCFVFFCSVMNVEDFAEPSGEGTTCGGGRGE